MQFRVLVQTILPLVAICALTAASVIAEPGESEPDNIAMKIIEDLQVKIKVMADKQKSLSNNLILLQRKLGDGIDKPSLRMRRNAAEGQTQSLPTNLADGCVPGTVGCPVNVTPYSVGGSCILCPAGPRGYTGPVGAPGRDGRDGRDAMAIVTSTDDPRLSPTLHTTSAHTELPSNRSGAIYVRWGHSECPPSASLVYSGIAGGAKHSSTGNGANYMCMPPDPVYDDPVSGVASVRAYIVGVEYQIDTFPNLVDRSYHDMPCAVCKSTSRFSKLMIPAKNTCPSDEWTLEYGGYLMAERSHASHQRSMYICVDRALQTLDRTHGSASARGLLDLVESRCSSSGGGLPCGPYIDGYELTCAVCTL
ncbi:putative short-chain collagen C4 [Apostichopus japonicus]|uniref:Putative short-chain collagen C4 n=1 Tax=Stichopus japonicus TaxID=307972 RepID=A0A2G8JQY7_STIJA|nr:putative short-chain collagen C4 [Apostichopus japonicus]